MIKQLEFELNSYFYDFKNKKYPKLTIKISTGTKCNLNCSYCLQNEEKHKNHNISDINVKDIINKIESFKRDIKIIVVGGEPTIMNNFVYFISELTKLQNVKTIVVMTNLLTDTSILRKVNKLKLRFDVSLHYEELIRKKLESKFLDNFKIVRPLVDYVGVVADPRYSDNDVSTIKKTFKEVPWKFKNYIGEYEERNYPNEYTNDELERFELKNSLEKYVPKETCSVLNKFLILTNDHIYPCSTLLGLDVTNKSIKYSHSDINEEFNLMSNSFKCPLDYCGCPEDNI